MIVFICIADINLIKFYDKIITLRMFCGCQGKKKAVVEKNNESIDSPFQVRLIKMLGLHSMILDKFVFRRKPSSYSIKNIKGNNCMYYQQSFYQSPDFYRTQVQILQTETNSTPVVRLYPIKLQEGEKVPCIIYIHGNSSDLGDSLRFITMMAKKFKAEYVAFDFTGYGQSLKPNVGEDVICRDLQLVLAWLQRPLEQVILWGFSLGTFPAIVNAAKYKVKANILQCPIGSLSCMFYDDYERDIKFKDDHFANIDYIANASGRILIMHSAADEIIPIEQAKLLYDKYLAQNGDKFIQFIEVEKIKHNALHKYIVSSSSNSLQKEVLNFLQLNKKQIQKSSQQWIVNDKLQQIRKMIKTVQLMQQIQEEQDFELAFTESKQSNKNSKQSSQDWFCYRK